MTFQTLPSRPLAVSNTPKMPPGHFGGSRVAPGLFRTLPKCPRGVLVGSVLLPAIFNASEALLAVSEAPELPLGRFGRSRSSFRPFPMLPSLPQVVSDTSESPPGRFGRFVKFPCCRENFRQLPPTFHAAEKYSVNFSHLFMQPEDFPSTFCAAERLSVKFCRLSVRLGDLPSTFVLFPSGWGTFIQMLSTSVRPGDVSTTSINLLCGCEIFGKFPLTLCAAGRLSANFCYLSEQPGNYWPNSIYFPCGHKFFRPLFVWPEVLTSAFSAAGRNFFNFRQFSERNRDLL